jgi:hypothetical protein
MGILLKFERILTLLIKKKTGIEMIEIYFYNTFECIWFKHVLALKFMNFEYVVLKNIIHFYEVVKNMNASYT